jgi:PAS domain S-box-containing protein
MRRRTVKDLLWMPLWTRRTGVRSGIPTVTSADRRLAARNVLVASLVLLCIGIPVIVVQVSQIDNVTVRMVNLDCSHQAAGVSRALINTHSTISQMAATLTQAVSRGAGELELIDFSRQLLVEYTNRYHESLIRILVFQDGQVVCSWRQSGWPSRTLPDPEEPDLRRLLNGQNKSGTEIPATIGPLRQETGRHIVLVTASYRRPDDSPSFGVVVAEVDFDRLMKDHSRLAHEDQLRQEIRRDDDTHLYGVAGLMAEFPTKSEFGVPGQKWRLFTVPRDGWASQFGTQVFQFSMLGSLVLAGSGTIVWRLTISHCLLVQELKQKSEALNAANRRMQEDLERIRITQQQLAVSEMRTRTIYEQMPVGVGLLDANSGQFLAVNPQGCQILAATETDLRQKCLQDLILCSETEPDSSDRNLQQIPLGECFIRAGNQSVRRVQLALAPVLGREGEAERQLAVLQDVTERWQAQQEIREQQERIQVLTDMLPGPLLFIDADNRCQFANAAARALLEKINGLSAGSPLGRSTDELLPPVIREFLKPWIADALGGDSSQFETTPEMEQLGYGAWMFFYRPLRRQHRVIGFFAFLLDITQQRYDDRRRREFDSRMAEAQRMETVGTLAGGVAHEFNNMLQVVLGFADVLLVHAEHDAFAVENLNHIRHAGRRASDLTRQLLAFARFQPGSPLEVNFADLIPASLQLLRHAAGDRIKLQWICDEPIDNVLIDPSHLDLILANLILNARHAMEDCGVIEIVARNLPANDSAEPGFALAGQAMVLVSVRDTGCGMNPEVQARMFDPFFSTRAVGKGTGLGLSTVYGLVLQAGGRIDIRSAPGKGTCIHLLFPARAESPPPPLNAPLLSKSRLS